MVTCMAREAITIEASSGLTLRHLNDRHARRVGEAHLTGQPAFGAALPDVVEHIELVAVGGRQLARDRLQHVAVAGGAGAAAAALRADARHVMVQSSVHDAGAGRHGHGDRRAIGLYECDLGHDGR
jgi:hypothetical protein